METAVLHQAKAPLQIEQFDLAEPGPGKVLSR